MQEKEPTANEPSSPKATPKKEQPNDMKIPSSPTLPKKEDKLKKFTFTLRKAKDMLFSKSESDTEASNSNNEETKKEEKSQDKIKKETETSPMPARKDDKKSKEEPISIEKLVEKPDDKKRLRSKTVNN